jgi:hypothetical protein
MERCRPRVGPAAAAVPRAQDGAERAGVRHLRRHQRFQAVVMPLPMVRRRASRTSRRVAVERRHPGRGPVAPDRMEQGEVEQGEAAQGGVEQCRPPMALAARHQAAALRTGPATARLRLVSS